MFIYVFVFLSWAGSILWFFCRRSISKVESTISGGGSYPILLRLCSIIPQIPYNINFQSATFCIHHSLSRSTLYFLNYRPNTSSLYKLSIKVFLHPLGSSTLTLCSLWTLIFFIHLNSLNFNQTAVEYSDKNLSNYNYHLSF